MFDSMFGRSFNSGKCKTLLKLAVSRIKLLKNKRDIQVKQMRRDLAGLLQTGQEPSAWIRVEHIIREENIMAAYEIVEFFCELIAVRLPIIESQRTCPMDLREAISSLIFAAPRCADLPELLQIRSLFSAKYGKEFVAAAAELRPDCGVNRRIIEKLSVRAPSGEIKMKMMKDVAAEHNVDWDPTMTEAELLRLPEDLLEGPSQIMSASQAPISAAPKQQSTFASNPIGNGHNRFLSPNLSPQIMSASQAPISAAPKQQSTFASNPIGNGQNQFLGPNLSPLNYTDKEIPVSQAKSIQDDTATRIAVEASKQNQDQDENYPLPLKQELFRTSQTYISSKGGSFPDVVTAARVAMESAKRAAMAARAAASLARLSFEKQDSFESNVVSSMSENEKEREEKPRVKDVNKERKSFDSDVSDEPVFDQYYEYTGSRDNDSDENESSHLNLYKNGNSKINMEKHPNPDYLGQPHDGELAPHFPAKKVKGPSNAGTFGHLPSNLYKEELSDYESFKPEYISSPPQRPPPGIPTSNHEQAPFLQQNGSFQTPSVHPRLPDYDDLAARFEALKTKR